MPILAIHSALPAVGAPPVAPLRDPNAFCEQGRDRSRPYTDICGLRLAVRHRGRRTRRRRRKLALGSDSWTTAETEGWQEVGHWPLAGEGESRRALRASNGHGHGNGAKKGAGPKARRRKEEV